MIESIQIKNLKSIKDSGIIDLKPVTVLIGKNSSGKSTLLRVFPLMKQSFLYNLADPVLWYGDYVDFGSFKNSIHSSCDKGKDTIQLSFRIYITMDKYGFRRRANISRTKLGMVLTFYVKEHLISRYDIKLDNGDLYSLIFNNNSKSYSLSINNKKYIENGFFVPNSSRRKMPIRGDYDLDSGYLFYYSYSIDERIISKYSKDGRFGRFVYENTDYGFGKNFSYPEILEHARNYLKNISDGKIEIDEEDVVIAAASIIKNTVADLLNSIDENLSADFLNIEYFQPIRARGDRFYRVQGLNTSGIDSDGQNGPMFLFSMSGQNRNKFEKWCLENFGFTYRITDNKYGDESTSVTIKTKDNDEEHNLTDVGFGYSQIFPIILSLWNDSAKIDEKKEKIIVIEQPELHLHPAFQKQIMKSIFKIVELSKRNKTGIKFIIETHSETIINYLGKRIVENDNKKDINLIVCNKIKGSSEFEKMVFDNRGLIVNWPIGFFSSDNDY